MVTRQGGASPPEGSGICVFSVHLRLNGVDTQIMEATAALTHGQDEAVHQPGDKISGACHCGRVAFLLCCEKPLASKLCHCDTCKTIHGKVEGASQNEKRIF